MAARVSPRLGAEWRAKIKVSMLINRLQDYAEGRRGVDMTRGQVQAAIALLKKTVPDLQSVDIGNADGQPLQVNLVRFGGNDG